MIFKNKKVTDNLAVIVCSHVAERKSPLLFLEKSEPEMEADSGWQAVCGSEMEDWEQAQVWSLCELLSLEPTLEKYIDYPVGTILKRDDKNSQWKVYRS